MKRSLTLFCCFTTCLSQISVISFAATNTLTGWSTGCSAASFCNLALSEDVSPITGFAYLNVSFSLQGNDWNSYAQTSSGMNAGLDPIGIQFRILQPNATREVLNSTVTIVDDSDKYWTATPPMLPGEWTNISLTWFDFPGLKGQAPGYPFRSISFGVDRLVLDAGWLGVADAALVTNVTGPALPLALSFLHLQPRPDTAGVLLPTDAPVVVGLEVTNRYESDCDAELVLRQRSAVGPMGEGADGTWDGWSNCTQGPVRIPGFAAMNVTCSIDPSITGLGWTGVQALLTGSTCWRAGNDTARLWEAAVAVVQPQPAYTPVLKNVRPNVFGGQMEPTAAAVAAIGMVNLRSGPLWRWAQPAECWNTSDSHCFDWGFYDGIFQEAAAGIEIMIDAREIAPPWAAKNNSGPSWAEFPTPDNYANYARYLSLMLDRYGAMATAVEVSNENDGLAYFQPQPIPMDSVCLPLSQALVNLTAQGIAGSVNGTGLTLVGLSSSMFDVKQTGNGGSTYAYYERAMLNAPGMLSTLAAVTGHPYTTGVQVPWIDQPWGNVSFQWPNEANAGQNSTVAQLLSMVQLMQEAAALQGLEGYVAQIRPSEWGYALGLRTPSTSPWAVMFAAAVAQGMVHMRSYPLAQYVTKSFLFAAYDGCCPESDFFYGIWRPTMIRTGVNATDPGPNTAPYPDNTGGIMPLPGVAAYSTASLLLDVPSGRAPGVFVLDHTAQGGIPVPSPTGQGTVLPPTCVAFEPAQGTAPDTAAVAVLFINGHHYNDRVSATLPLPGGPASGARLFNGLHATLPMVYGGPGDAALQLTITPLPQYLLLPPASGINATSACTTLAW